MKLLKTIFSIVLKIFAGLVLFYFFCAFVVIPIAVPWVIQAQGKKILKKIVYLRAAVFNPFMLRFSLRGLKITDEHKQDLVGFERFSVDASFLSLLKKIYRVESVDLDGLFVHASLVSEGHVDLMDLVPPPGLPEASKTPPEENIQKPLPVVFVDQIRLKNGTIRFADKTMSVPFMTELHDIGITVDGFSTEPDDITKVVFHGRLDKTGMIDTEAQLKPWMTPFEIELTFKLNEYAMTVLGPYVGRYTGRELQDGKLDVGMTYRISENQITASHKILIQHFEFGKKVESKDALNLPFGLAVALLEDPQGRINISLPVKGDMSAPEFKYSHLIWQVTRNFFVKLVTKPFAVLGSIIGSDSGTDELGAVSFPPGKAELSDQEKEKLNLLVKGLKDRPKLLLEVNGSYDPQVDWKAIKLEHFKKDYNVLRGESKKTDDWVFQSLYQERFGLRELWKLTKSFKQKNGEYDSQEMNAEIKQRLIEAAPPDKVAMEVLAQSRAKSVYDELIALGLEEKRLQIGRPHETQGSMGSVPLEFTLTVFDEPEHSEQNP